MFLTRQNPTISPAVFFPTLLQPFVRPALRCSDNHPPPQMPREWSGRTRTRYIRAPCNNDSSRQASGSGARKDPAGAEGGLYDWPVPTRSHCCFGKGTRSAKPSRRRSHASSSDLTARATRRHGLSRPHPYLSSIVCGSAFDESLFYRLNVMHIVVQGEDGSTGRSLTTRFVRVSAM